MPATSIAATSNEFRENGPVSVFGGTDSLVTRVIHSAGQGAVIGGSSAGSVGAMVGGAIGALVSFVAHLLE
jgi:uncharacterized membrane protein